MSKFLEILGALLEANKDAVETNKDIEHVFDAAMANNETVARSALVTVVMDTFHEGNWNGKTIDEDWASYKAECLRRDPEWANVITAYGWDDMLLDIKKELDGEIDDEYLGKLTEDVVDTYYRLMPKL